MPIARTCRLWTVLVTIILFPAAALPASAQDAGVVLPDWATRIRSDHPRVLFNRDDIPKVRAQAERFQDHFAALHKKIADIPAAVDPDAEPQDWGYPLMAAAVIYQVTGDPDVLDQIRGGLRDSLRFYHQQYDNRQPVNWYAWSRLGWLVALDVAWNDLPDAERRELSESFIEHLRQFYPIGRKIPREGKSGTSSGFYGVSSLYWFAGVLWHDEGINDAQALDWLEKGYEQHLAMLQHRAALAGPSGGSASGTMGYTMQHYLFAERNFFFSVEAATGYDIAQDWDYVTRIPAYLWWNWLPDGLEFGYGDAQHHTNRLPADWLPMHMAAAMHFYGQSHPDAAATARSLRERAVEEGFSKPPSYVDGFQTHYLAIYPYLVWNMDQAPPAAPPVENPPLARYFEQMGQTFIRTGDDKDDTFILISAGGDLTNHRHYDAGHFTLYHRGFLALDSGTRRGNLPHLYTYYAQTIAHNTLLIDMPGEEVNPYWARRADVAQGGQNRIAGSEVTAFETVDDWVYLALNLTPVYHEDKAEQVLRQFVFLAPDVLVIFDRVTSDEPEYEKTWLLHTANEPIITGSRFHADQDEGRLIATTLLPQDARITPVGGPGREFLVAGQNFPIQDSDLIDGEVPETMGRWRVEVSPDQPRTDDLFLHVIEVGDQTRKSTTNPRVEVADDHVELTLHAQGRPVTLRFTTSGSPAGQITFRDEPDAQPHRFPQSVKQSN